MRFVSTLLDLRLHFFEDSTENIHSQPDDVPTGFDGKPGFEFLLPSGYLT